MLAICRSVALNHVSWRMLYTLMLAELELSGYGAGFILPDRFAKFFVTQGPPINSFTKIVV